MYLVLIAILGASFKVTGAQVTPSISHPLGRNLASALTDSYVSLACAEAIADGLGAPNATWWNSSASSILQAQLIQLVRSVLNDDQRCAAKASDDTVLTVTWMQCPSWVNGIFTSWLWRLQSNAATASSFAQVKLAEPQQLPAPAAVTAASTLRDFAARDTVIQTSDLSGFSPLYVLEQKGVADYPENVCLVKSSPQGPLHPRTFLLAFYRADVLKVLHEAGHTASAAPPADWDGLLGLLNAHDAALQAGGGGAPAAAGSLPTYGMCVATDPTCGRLGDLLAAIAASVVQTSGTRQGYVFDLKATEASGGDSGGLSATPLVNGTGWRHALEVLRLLLQYNAPDYGSAAAATDTDTDTATSSSSTSQKCYTFSQWFANGDCMVTIEWDIAFKWMASEKLSRPGALRVAPLPGSRQVLDQNTTTLSGAVASGVMAQCNANPALCAVSRNHDLLYLSSAGQAAAAVVAARDAHARCGTAELVRMEAAAAAAAVTAEQVTMEAAAVNRAPYSALLEYYAAINYERFAVANLARQMSLLQSNLSSKLRFERMVRQDVINAMRQAAAAAAGATTSAWNATTFPATPWWPGIAGNGDGIPAAALKPYTDAGHDAGAVRSYLQALWHAVHSPNLAPDVPAPVMTNWFKWALSHVALTLRPPQPDVGAPAAQLARLFKLVVEAHTPAAVGAAYEAAIGAPKADKPDLSGGQVPVETADSNSSGNSSGPSTGVVAGTVAACVAGLLLLGFLVGLVVRRLRFRHRNLLGRVVAPRAGPDTTLLISDIQNSTALWEALPEQVMDAALKLHHSTFRRLLPNYDGYESGTEGDSFLLAFANPVTAVAFAAACQVELLLQEWPQELLEQPDGELVLVDPGDGEAAQQAGTMALLAGDVRRIASRTTSGPAASLLSSLAARLRSVTTSTKLSFTSAPLFRLAAPVSPQPSVSQLPTLPLSLPPSYPTTGLAARGASVFDMTAAETSVWSGALIHGGGGGPAAISAAAVAANRSISGGAADGSPAIAVVLRGGAAAGDGGDGCSSNLRAGAALSPKISGSSMDLAVRAEACGAGSKLFATRGERSGGGGFCGGSGFGAFGGGGGSSPQLPTLRETPAAPWLMPPSSQWLAALQAAFPAVPSQEAPVAITGGQALRSPLVVLLSGRQALVAYRGLRVRMGLHAGLDDPQHVVFNKVATAYKYQGPFLDAARCTIDTAPGGMVVLTSQAFARLRHGVDAPGNTAATAKRRRLLPRSPEAIILYAGHHVLKTALPPRPRPPVAAATRSGSRPSSRGATRELPVAPPSVVRFSVPLGEAEDVNEHGADGCTAEGMALYQAVPTVLVCRLALAGTLVSRRVVQLSSLSAPIGSVSVAFMYVVGASTLLSELPGPAQHALAQFQRLVFRLLGAAGGYLVEGGDGGLVLAAFGTPTAAVEWALDCVEALKKLDWEPELLTHWLCEEVLSVGVARSDTTTSAAAASAMAASAAVAEAAELVDVDDIGGGGRAAGAAAGLPPPALDRRRSLKRVLSRMPSMARLGAMATTCRVLERGLRIKVGLDMGLATHSLNEASGRLAYRGKVMNRASRVAGKAAAGQVVCTDACWRGCLERAVAAAAGVGEEGCIGDSPPGSPPEAGQWRGSRMTSEGGDGSDAESIGGLVGISLGKVALKGVTAPVELIQCMRG